MTTAPMRSRDEVIGRVLEAAREGSSKTNIMYKSFVSFDKLEELLERLIADDLLVQEKGEITYRTTQKGLEFLNKLNCCDRKENQIFSINRNDDDGNIGTEHQPTFVRSNLDPIQFAKILVIGLGQLGLPVAKYVKDRGFDVYGYDISTKALERAEKTAGIKKAVDFSGFDVYIICVSTHKQEDMFSPQIEGILSIVQDKISKEAKNGALVAIESTIPKGTSKKVFEMLNHRLHVAHAPHRWYALEEKEHGVNQLRVVGGVCDCCLRVAMQFYDGSEKSSFSLSPQSSSLNELESQADIATAPQSARTPGSTDDGLKMTVTATALTASGERDDSKKDLKYSQHGTTLSRDMQSSPRSPSSVTTATIGSKAHSASKVIDNTKKTRLGIPMHPVPDIEIAELRDSLNTKWNVNILEPREGIGGHCLPKDTKMFLNSSKSIKSKIIGAALEVDDEYRIYRENRSGRIPHI